MHAMFLSVPQPCKFSVRRKEKRQASRFAKTDSGSADDWICRRGEGLGGWRLTVGAGMNL
jgi:hypothetical protein